MIAYSTFSDKHLIGLLIKSDHTAYTEIYRRYFHLIFRHAYKKLRDEQVAKDVVQDVFTNLWVKRSSCVVESNLAGYLFTAVRNRVFNFWAHEDIKSKYWDSFSDGNPIEKYADVSTDHRIREQQLMAYIERQVQELPPKMRRIFELSRKEYLTHREIAGRLNTSEENVSKQIGNALKILRARLGTMFYLLLMALILMAGSHFRLSFFGFIQVVNNF